MVYIYVGVLVPLLHYVHFQTRKWGGGEYEKREGGNGWGRAKTSHSVCFSLHCLSLSLSYYSGAYLGFALLERFMKSLPMSGDALTKSLPQKL